MWRGCEDRTNFHMYISDSFKCIFLPRFAQASRGIKDAGFTQPPREEFDLQTKIPSGPQRRADFLCTSSNMHFPFLSLSLISSVACNLTWLRPPKTTTLRMVLRSTCCLQKKENTDCQKGIDCPCTIRVCPPGSFALHLLSKKVICTRVSFGLLRIPNRNSSFTKEKLFLTDPDSSETLDAVTSDNCDKRQGSGRSQRAKDWELSVNC